jgi:tryptophan synthase alpha chain
MTCTITVERLADGRFRASCQPFPECAAVAATEAEARRQVESMLAAQLEGRADQSANPIDKLFDELRANGRKAFMPFVTAGDPSLAATGKLVHKLADSGANLIEVGFPYSDPIADGPVIQASYTRALDKGLKLDEIFRWAGETLPRLSIPAVAMVSYSLVHRRGPDSFLDQARAAGFAGAIVPDLPVEEAEVLAQLAAVRNLKLIQLVTPTTPPERAARIVRQCTGFIYVVSVAGITGERDQLPTELIQQLRRLRQDTSLPLCVGFGVSKPAHVRMLREHVDGLIVGSAIVRRLEHASNLDAAIDAVGEFVRELVAVLNPG